MTRPSIFEAAGGAPALLALATAHHQRCLADPVLNHPFSHGGHPQHLERLASYWGEVLGGPPGYTESCGGQPAMLHIHAGTDADDDMPTRFLDCFLLAIDDAGLPPDPQLRSALRDYMVWAVHDVHAYSPAGSEVPLEAAVPRWSWDGLHSPGPVGPR